MCSSSYALAAVATTGGGGGAAAAALTVRLPHTRILLHIPTAAKRERTRLQEDFFLDSNANAGGGGGSGAAVLTNVRHTLG